MFDFAWSEILLIGAVALIAIGPKDMPAAIRTVSSMVKKARRMAAEFQTHVDEMVREADLGDVKKAFNDLRNLDLSGAIEKHIDPDRSIRNTFADNPLDSTVSSAAAAMEEVTPTPFPDPLPEPLIEVELQRPLAPAFIPPGMVPPPEPQAAVQPPEAPAFVPPEAVLQRQSKA
jgi:sec-independent protein translocase protein TatB